MVQYLTQHKLGEQITARGGHWRLDHHDEVFLVEGREGEDERLLQRTVDWVLDRPAIVFLLRIYCPRCVFRRCLERQIFGTEGSEKLVCSLCEVLARIVDAQAERLLLVCLVRDEKLVAQVLSRDKLAEGYDFLVNRCDFSDIELLFLAGLS